MWRVCSSVHKVLCSIIMIEIVIKSDIECLTSFIDLILFRVLAELKLIIKCDYMFKFN
jgi:hypothetical protein